MNINERDINQLLSTGEGLTFEIKTASTTIPKSFWESCSAFANTNGGIIILGISEDAAIKVTGVENPSKLIDDIISTARSSKISYNIFSMPENVKAISYKDKNIIVCNIPEAPYDQKPVYLNNSLENSYIRRGSGDYKMSKSELSSIMRDANHELDRKLLDNFTINDLDVTSILKYKALLHKIAPSRHFDSQNLDLFLENMDVFVFDRVDQKKKLTLAGLLFFGKLSSIKSFIPSYHVDFFDKRRSVDRWRDRVDSEDLSFENLNLFNYYDIVINKLSLSIERNFELDNQTIRKSSDELLVALREAFVNMIVHADYLAENPTLIVEIHEPYYIFLNPGKMKITKEEFFCGSRSVARNPILISLFTKMGAAERAGSGSQKIIDVVKKNSFKYPEIDTTIEETKLKLWIAHLIDSLDVTDIEKNIYTIIANSYLQGTTKKEIEEKLPEYTSPQIRTALEKLVAKNLIHKIGGKRNRAYIKNVSDIEIIKTLERVAEIAKENFKKRN